MFERVKKLHEIADQMDKAELSIQSSAVQNAMTAHRDGASSATLKSWQANKEALQDLIDRLWPKYFPGESGRPGGSDAWFRNKAAAWDVYRRTGKLGRSSFFEKVPTVGKKVSCMVVENMLLREENEEKSARPSAPVEYDTARDEARFLKAKADREEFRRDDEKRALDAKWVLRESAEEETCVWVSRLRDAVAYHIGKNQLAIIHACGGNPARLSEVQSIIDAALAAACNEIANSAEVTVEIEDLEEVVNAD